MDVKAHSIFPTLLTFELFESHKLLTNQAKIPPSDQLFLCYFYNILPQLTYCHVVWNFCRSSDNRTLERIQERALRAIFNRKSGIYDELLKLAKLPTLKNRRLQDIAVLMYKVKNELYNIALAKRAFWLANKLDRFARGLHARVSLFIGTFSRQSCRQS